MRAAPTSSAPTRRRLRICSRRGLARQARHGAVRSTRSERAPQEEEGPRTQAVSGDRSAAEARRRLTARELGKLDEAVAAYRDLVESDPGDLETVRALDGILRAAGRRDDLRWLFELRAAQVGGDPRAEILEEWAALEEEVFADPAQAIALFRKVIDLSPSRACPFRALSAVARRRSSDYAGAAEVMERFRDVSEGEDRGAPRGRARRRVPRSSR